MYDTIYLVNYNENIICYEFGGNTMNIISIVLLLIIITLSDDLLKKKLKPNEELLEEIENLEFSRKILISNIIIFLAIMVSLEINMYLSVLMIIVALTSEWIRGKYTVKYLNDKSENESTKKYIFVNIILQHVYGILLIMYLVFFKFK